MKKPVLLLIVPFLFLTSCSTNEGPVGPPGPEGPQGPVGPVGKGFEVEATFSQANDYSQVFAFPENVEVLSTDIVAAYLLWEIDPDTGNDVWQPLPVSIFFDNGELQYAFDHTLADVKLFLTGDTDLGALNPEYTRNQIFRIAILPVDYVQGNKINTNNIEEVMGAVNFINLKKLSQGD